MPWASVSCCAQRVMRRLVSHRFCSRRLIALSLMKCILALSIKKCKNVAVVTRPGDTAMAGISSADLPVTDERGEGRRMAATTSSYSITMRLHTAPDHGIVGAVATAIATAGGVVTAIDVAESSHERLVVDVTCSAADAEHASRLEAAVSEVPGVEVYKVSDRTFLLHIGGKIEVTSKVPLRNRDDLS